VVGVPEADYLQASFGVYCCWNGMAVIRAEPFRRYYTKERERGRERSIDYYKHHYPR